MKEINARLAELVAKPSDINEHLLTLKRYAARCNDVVEFGVRGAVSTWALLAGRPKRLRSFDIVHPDQCGGDLAALERAADAAGIEFSFTQASDLDIEPVKTDLLFIDTLHVYDQLTAELRLHAPTVRLWIIMHDTTTFGERGEVAGQRGLWPAVKDFLAGEGRAWQVSVKYPNNNGLTVLERHA